MRLKITFWKKLISAIVVSLALMVMLLYVYADCRRYVPVFEKTQIWSHRGYTERWPHNSLPAFREALALGADGLEMDIFWDDKLGTFVVSHDAPYIKPFGHLLTLQEVFDSLPVRETNIWLDLKNLDRSNAKKVTETLNGLLNKYQCRKNVFVESGNGWQLRQLDKAGIRTLYWVQFSRFWPKQVLKLTYIHFLLFVSDFDGLTTAHYLYDDTFRRQFHNYPIFVWHVDDTEVIKSLRASSDANVILTNTNMFYLNRYNKIKEDFP
jgi:hypothetical protein